MTFNQLKSKAKAGFASAHYPKTVINGNEIMAVAHRRGRSFAVNFYINNERVSAEEAKATLES